MNLRRVLLRAMNSPGSLRFDEMRALAEGFGFRLDRINGSHHIFTHDSLSELVNIQNVKGKAKAYQVRQLIRLVERYNLRLEDGE